MTRIFMTKYYRDAGDEGDNEFRATLNMISALTTISNNGVLIWVAGRICRALTAETESYETLTTLLQKEEYRKYFTLQFYSLFHEIPNNRIDLSSSEIRATSLHLLTSSSEVRATSLHLLTSSSEIRATSSGKDDTTSTIESSI